jgi:hypothetical protein
VDPRARTLLEKLLLDAEKAGVGARVRPPALTKSALGEYRAERSLTAKESFETSMRAARAEGAVELQWDNAASSNGFIVRVDVLDKRRLAGFLGTVPLEDVMAQVRQKLAPLQERFPVIEEVVQAWSKMRSVRGMGTESVDDWIDAARTIDETRKMVERDELSAPIREVSARLFANSKRIEQLVVPTDVLLAGTIDTQPRETFEVWEELGLFREQHPVRLAGAVVLERDGVTARLDIPYVGLPAATIRRAVSRPNLVMTIEGQTTFHSEARRRCQEPVLLIFTAGMPSPAWRAMYGRLLQDLPVDVPIYHWGDIDEGGLRIAARLAQDAQAIGRAIEPWRMHPNDVPAEQRRPATAGTLARMQRYAQTASWTDLGQALREAGFTIEQEALE